MTCSWRSRDWPRGGQRAADEREVLLGMLETDAALVTARPGQTLIGDKDYFGRDFEEAVAGSDLALLLPVGQGEAARAGRQLFKPLRQVIESVNQTLKAQLELEGHGGRTEEGIFARILYRLLALAAAIWHNDKTSQDANHTTRNQSSRRPVTATAVIRI
jgi:predicted alpha-1,6-mannanase (GH76 family)